MPQQTLPHNYSALCSDFLAKLIPIFGRDAVIQTVMAVPEVELEEVRTDRTHRTEKTNNLGLPFSIKAIQGDPEVVFDKLSEEFSELSPYVVDRARAELHDEREGNE